MFQLNIQLTRLAGDFVAQLETVVHDLLPRL